MCFQIKKKEKDINIIVKQIYSSLHSESKTKQERIFQMPLLFDRETFFSATNLY